MPRAPRPSWWPCEALDRPPRLGGRVVTPPRAVELKYVLSSVQHHFELGWTIAMNDADDDAVLACPLNQPDGDFVRRHALLVHGDRRPVKLVP